MALQVPSLQGSSMFTATPSDTLFVSSDPNNTNQFGYVYLHNTAAGATVRVLAVDDSVAQTIYIPQGGIFPVMVKKIFATSPVAPAGLICIGSRTRLG